MVLDEYRELLNEGNWILEGSFSVSDSVGSDDDTLVLLSDDPFSVPDSASCSKS